MIVADFRLSKQIRQSRKHDARLHLFTGFLLYKVKKSTFTPFIHIFPRSLIIFLTKTFTEITGILEAYGKSYF